MKPLPPGSTIGILGSGQLGRMLAMAAARMGYHVHIFCPETDGPAVEVSKFHTRADFSNVAALKEFSSKVDVITFEFENIELEGLSAIKGTPIYPAPEVVAICQHRIKEKSFIQSLGIKTAAFAAVHSADECADAVSKIGAPGILKTCRFGYDGKGQSKIMTPADAKAAWDALGTKEAIYEQFVEFEREISVIVARSANGEVASFPPVHNIHKDHILHQTHVPAGISDKLAAEAEAIAQKIADGIKLVGILAIEMFVTKSGEVVVNELAPRPHNSGHWTMDACETSQFEQTVRAICGIPLGGTRPICDAVMTNLIGHDVDAWETYLKKPNTHLHLYGKAQARPGRKMGHVTELKRK